MKSKPGFARGNWQIRATPLRVHNFPSLEVSPSLADLLLLHGDASAVFTRCATMRRSIALIVRAFGNSAKRSVVAVLYKDYVIPRFVFGADERSDHGTDKSRLEIFGVLGLRRNFCECRNIALIVSFLSRAGSKLTASYSGAG